MGGLIRVGQQLLEIDLHFRFIAFHIRRKTGPSERGCYENPVNQNVRQDSKTQLRFTML